MKNIQREEFRGCATDGGEVRIEQVGKPSKFGIGSFFGQNVSAPVGGGCFQPAEEKPQD